MWNFQAASKICELKQQANSYDRHKKTLQKAKPTVDNGNPYLNELSSRLTNKFESNSALLHRMMYISSHRGTLNKQKFIKSYKEQSHVFKITKKKYGHQDEFVQDQNQKIINRLQSTKSYYERDSQVKEAQKYLACRQNISQNARRAPYQDLQEDIYCLAKTLKQKYEQ